MLLLSCCTTPSSHSSSLLITFPAIVLIYCAAGGSGARCPVLHGAGPAGADSMYLLRPSTKRCLRIFPIGEWPTSLGHKRDRHRRGNPTQRAECDDSHFWMVNVVQLSAYTLATNDMYITDRNNNIGGYIKGRKKCGATKEQENVELLKAPGYYNDGKTKKNK